MDMLKEFAIDEFLNSSAGEALKRTMETLAFVQNNLVALAENEDPAQLNLLKIGTVFQIFLIDTLASGKKANEMDSKDWRHIAEKVSKYAVLEEGQSYSEFVFSLYADYIAVSVKKLRWVEEKLKLKGNNERLTEIESLEKEIRLISAGLREGTVRESDFVERSLWLSLEAMVKLISYWLTSKLALAKGEEYAVLAQSVTDLAFEYGRYMLYAKEQKILDAYIQNQYLLDDELRTRFEEYLAELNENAARFQSLIDGAFSPDIQTSLMQSAALARAAGVKEEELLTSTEDIDAFFLN